MWGQYEIQVCNLTEVISKSRVEWKTVRRAYHLPGAKRILERRSNNSDDCFVYRVVDTKTGKAVA